MDLAEHLRIAARDKRIAQELAAERESRARRLPVWLLLFGLAIIVLGLSTAMTLVHLWSR